MPSTSGLEAREEGLALGHGHIAHQTAPCTCGARSSVETVVGKAHATQDLGGDSGMNGESRCALMRMDSRGSHDDVSQLLAARLVLGYGPGGGVLDVVVGSMPIP